jgi:hypothetical protein
MAKLLCMLREILFSRRRIMAGKTTFSPETIKAAKKRLRKLPVKQTGKNMEETMAVLAEDVRNSLRKGYSLKEIRELLAEDGLKLPASVLKTYLAQEQKQDQDQDQDQEQGQEQGQDQAREQETSLPETKTNDDKQETRIPDTLIVQLDTPEALFT